MMILCSMPNPRTSEKKRYLEHFVAGFARLVPVLVMLVLLESCFAAQEFYPKEMATKPEFLDWEKALLKLGCYR